MIVRDPTIVERYAQALYGAGKKLGKKPELLEQTEALRRILLDEPRVLVLLEAPQINLEVKERFLEKALKGKIDPLIYQLMILLLHKGRIGLICSILDRVRTVVENAFGIYEADVETARTLDEEQRTDLHRALEKFTAAKLRLRYHVNPDLLAGVRFTYGDVLIDGTVRGNLKKLRENLESAAQRHD